MHIKSYKSVKYYSTLLKVDKDFFNGVKTFLAECFSAVTTDERKSQTPTISLLIPSSLYLVERLFGNSLVQSQE